MYSVYNAVAASSLHTLKKAHNGSEIDGWIDEDQLVVHTYYVRILLSTEAKALHASRKSGKYIDR